MSKKIFFASAAKVAFALAAVVMMSLAFAACGSDNDDDGGGGGTPPLPTPKAQTVTLDGVEKPIVKAEYEGKGAGNYYIYLNLSADGDEIVEIDLNKKLHMSGASIDLTRKEEEHTGTEYYWLVRYSKKFSDLRIYTFADPKKNYPVFKTGTLTATGDPATGTISIKLENGRVIGSDKKEHTLTLSYSGSITKQQ